MAVPNRTSSPWISRTFATILAALTMFPVMLALRPTSLEPGPTLALSWFLGFGIAQPFLLERVAGIKQTPRDWARYAVIGALAGGALWALRDM